MVDVDDELKNEYLLDIHDLITEAENSLILFEKNEIQFDTLFSAVFKTLHSLKGSLGMFGFEHLVETVHDAEASWISFEKTGVKEKDVDDFLKFLSEMSAAVDSDMTMTPSPLSDQKVSTEQENNETQKTKSDETQKTKSDDTQNTRKINSIIIIDDEPIFQDLLAEHLEGVNFNIIKASSVSEGISVLRDEKNIVAVFCDMHMPGDKGTSLLDVINNLNLKLPVIMMSQAAKRDDLIEMLKRRTFYFVEKSESFDEFDLALKKAIKEHIREQYIACHKMLKRKK